MLTRPPAVMWSVFFVFLYYLHRQLAKGEPFSVFLHGENEDNVLFYMLDNKFCGKISTAGEYSIYEVSDGVEKVRSVRDSAGCPVDCSTTANDIHVKSFMHVCRLGLREQKSESTGSELRLINVTEAKANCDNAKSKNTKTAAAQLQNPNHVQPGSDAHTPRRAKRGFTYPGTLWCGAGNIADDYGQLGDFAETDECCRTHDHCPHVIHAFSSKYGYTNFKWHSISHCDCDNAMKQCLREVNDTSSRVVGQAFFNVIEVPCFEFTFEMLCIERYWYGVCKRYGKVPVAVLRESIPYDFGGIEVIDVLTVSPPKKLAEVETTQASESTAQPTTEEQTLTNVVTAAEDFIKVLATVSTSQSSVADSSKGDVQAADKKRKKNAGKKKNESKRRREKGRGKKRKPSAGALAAEDGVVGTGPATRTEVVVTRNGLVEDSGNIDQVSENFMNGAFNQAGDLEQSNKMMRDEYQRMADESQDSTTTTPSPQQHHHHTSTTVEAPPNTETLELPKQLKVTESARLSSAIHIHSIVASKPRIAGLRQKVERKKKRYPALLPAGTHNMLEDATSVSMKESSSQADQTTRSPISPAGEEESRSSESQREKGSTFTGTTQNSPIVETKRPRSRQRGVRKRNRKLCLCPSPNEGEAPPPIAGGPVVITSNPTQDLNVYPSPEPTSSSEGSAGAKTGTVQLTKRLQGRLKGSRGRRRCALSCVRHSIGEVVSKKRLEATIITLNRTNISTAQAGVDAQVLPQVLPQSEEAEAGTSLITPDSGDQEEQVHREG
ncbi:uncharacterized protein proca1 [Brachyhypopomus gauderio]|uniref:uncharacterized protein proca1 n=1 Tax=Brachyhypopomus gauderio TaxID=698409 RepID=UPI004041DB0A